MKTVFLFFCSFWFAYTLQADCKDGFSIFPFGHTLSPHAKIILTGYMNSQQVVQQLNKKYPVCLKSGSSKVYVTVEAIYPGQFRETQAVLIPGKGLVPGLTYTLVIDSLPVYQTFTRPDPETGKKGAVQYRITESSDTIAPEFTAMPVELKKIYVSYGRGPIVYVVFDCPVKETSAYMIKATVTGRNTGAETSYYIKPEDGTIKIGHGMCSGPFCFLDGTEYDVSFSLLDSKGNHSITSGFISFSKPVY